jgi:nucleoid-associated protein EbfC
VFKGLSNLASMLRQAQHVSAKLQGLNEEMKTRRAKGTAGGGLVEVEVNGLGELIRVRIDPKLLEENHREMVEDLIPAAANQAIARSKEMHAQAMQSLTAGMEIPGLDTLGESNPSEDKPNLEQT